MARWSFAGLAALQLSLLPAEPSIAAAGGTAPAEAASTSGVTSALMPFPAGGSWSLEFLADASGVMSLLLGDAETPVRRGGRAPFAATIPAPFGASFRMVPCLQVVGPQAVSSLIGSTEDASSGGEPTGGACLCPQT